MMNTTLEDQLARYRTTLEHAIVSHDHGGLDDRSSENGSEDRNPLDDDAVHRRAAGRSRARSRVLVGAGVGAAALLVGGLATVSVIDTGATAWADWTPTTQDTDPARIESLDAACRNEANIADDTDALAYDVRGDGGVALYADGDNWAACQAELGDGTAVVSGVVGNPSRDLDDARTAVDRGRMVVTIALQWQGDPAASLVWGVHDPSVDRIVVGTSSGPVDATLLDGIWVAWWPSDDAETAGVRAESSGRVVVDEAAGRLAAPLLEPEVIAADVGNSGSAAERAALDDGVITWTEMAAALDAWQRCVADAGYDMIIEIDDASQTYTASTPIVSVAGDQGSPDDAAAAELLAPIEEAIEQCRTTHVSRLEQAFVQE